MNLRAALPAALVASLLCTPAAAKPPARGGSPTPAAASPAPPAPAPEAAPAPPPAPSLTARPAAKGRPKIAVWDVRALEGVSATSANVITEYLATEIQTMRRYEVISRADVAGMLGYQREKTMLGCSEDAACMAEIGGALGSDYVLSGQVAQFGARYRIALSLQDVKKAKVVSRQGSFCDRNEESLIAATREALTNIFRELESGGALPPPIVKPVAAPAAPPPASRTRVVGWSVAAVGLAGLAAGGVFDYLAYSAYQDEKKAGQASDAAEYERLKALSTSRGNAARLLYLGGAVATGAGVTLHFLGAPKAPVVGFAPLPGGAIATLTGSLP